MDLDLIKENLDSIRAIPNPSQIGMVLGFSLVQANLDHLSVFKISIKKKKAELKEDGRISKICPMIT